MLADMAGEISGEKIVNLTLVSLNTPMTEKPSAKFTLNLFFLDKIL